MERIRTSGGWPKLKAKAAATRHLAAYALYLITTYGDSSGDPALASHDQLATGVCQLLCRFYDILGSESMFLSSAVKAEMPELCRMITSMYARLAKLSFDMGLRMWKMMPKLHLFIHLCEDQAPRFGNPRYYWTYGDEDLVGQMITIAEGVHPRTLPISVLVKWLHAVFDQLLLPRDGE